MVTRQHELSFLCVYFQVNWNMWNVLKQQDPVFLFKMSTWLEFFMSCWRITPVSTLTCDVMIRPQGGWSPPLRYCYLSITTSRLPSGRTDRAINQARLLKINIAGHIWFMGVSKCQRTILFTFQKGLYLKRVLKDKNIAHWVHISTPCIYIFIIEMISEKFIPGHTTAVFLNPSGTAEPPPQNYLINFKYNVN
jgi:hypothetical protein